MQQKQKQQQQQQQKVDDVSAGVAARVHTPSGSYSQAGSNRDPETVMSGTPPLDLQILARRVQVTSSGLPLSMAASVNDDGSGSTEILAAPATITLSGATGDGGTHPTTTAAWRITLPPHSSCNTATRLIAPLVHFSSHHRRIAHCTIAAWSTTAQRNYFSLQRVHTHHTDHMLVVVVIAGFTWGPGSPVVTTKTASLVEWTSTGTSTGLTTKGVTATVNGSLWMDGWERSIIENQQDRPIM
jgi:hypothetical protein